MEATVVRFILLNQRRLIKGAFKGGGGAQTRDVCARARHRRMQLLVEGVDNCTFEAP